MRMGVAGAGETRRLRGLRVPSHNDIELRMRGELSMLESDVSTVESRCRVGRTAKTECHHLVWSSTESQCSWQR